MADDDNRTLKPHALRSIFASKTTPAANLIREISLYQAAEDIAKPRVQTMTIIGHQPGSIKAKLDSIRAKAEARRSGAMSKIDAADAKVAEVDAQLEQVAAQMEKEADAALQEFATFTNGGPS